MKSYLRVLLSAEVLAANGHDTIEHGKLAAYYLDMLPGGRRQSALAAKDELDIDVPDIGDRKVEDNANVDVGPPYSEPQSENEQQQSDAEDAGMLEVALAEVLDQEWLLRLALE